VAGGADRAGVAGRGRALTDRHTLTAQQVRSYKPALAHFHAGRERVAGRRWLRAAQGYIYDVEPCAQLGITVAWINRKSEAPTGAARPDQEFRTLTELADWLA